MKPQPPVIRRVLFSAMCITLRKIFGDASCGGVLLSPCLTGEIRYSKATVTRGHPARREGFSPERPLAHLPGFLWRKSWKMGEGIPLPRVILLLASHGVKGRGLIFSCFPRRGTPLVKPFFPLPSPLARITSEPHLESLFSRLSLSIAEIAHFSAGFTA